MSTVCFRRSAASLLIACAAANGQPVVSLTFAPELKDQARGPARLVVQLINVSEQSLAETSPHDGPLWSSPQPAFACNISDLTSTDTLTTFETLNSPQLRDLSGTFRVGARLLTSGTPKKCGDWRENDGNFTSTITTVTFKPGEPTPIQLTFDYRTKARAWEAQRAEALNTRQIEVESKLLTEFRGTPVMLRAGVVFPKDYDATRSYGTVYEVPGFGGRHFDSLNIASYRFNNKSLSQAEERLARESFWITLDPEGPNGHTLFANSANNGPVGEALVTELIPAIEKAIPAIKAEANARILRGHSSGGWSSIWLATTYPQTFGAAWSTSPDPVDFRRFQLIDIYGQRSMYTIQTSDNSFTNPLAQSKFVPVDVTSWGKVVVEVASKPQVVELGSFRTNGKMVMTVQREARGEDLIGPDNTSGQQWDSWFAVFGPRNSNKTPAALFDPATGVIDKSIAESYKAYDITQRLRDKPGEIGAILRGRIRIVVGEQDNFYLNEAVRLLVTDLGRFYPPQDINNELGYVEIIKDLDHSTVMRSPRVQGFPAEMMAHLERYGYSKRIP